MIQRIPTVAGYPNLVQAGAAAAMRVAARLREALDERERVLLVLTGGRSVRYLVRPLSRARLDWDRVTVTLSDERWVSTRHPDSNEGQLRALLGEVACGANVVGLKTRHQTPARAVRAVDARLARLPWPAAASVLGVGDDGHVASLFPGTPTSQMVGMRCLAARSPRHSHSRLSLTAPTLCASELVCLLYTGTAKSALIERARSGAKTEHIPLACLFTASGPPVEIHAAADA